MIRRALAAIRRWFRPIDWNKPCRDVAPPFDTWPRWATLLDIEIADIAGDVGALDQTDTPEGIAKLEAYKAVRQIIAHMVDNSQNVGRTCL